ncbi:hypothetical protein GGF43_006655, partial [Coemansia sp. RSA 2618]
MQCTPEPPTKPSAVDAELEWLLGHSIPENICLVGRHIAEISFLKNAAGKRAADPSSQTSLLSDDGADVKGTAAVSGTSVTQLSLTLPSYGQTGQGATTVYMKKGETLPLKQAQDSQSYVKSALRQAQSMPKFETREYALSFIERMLGDIQRAKNILVADSQHGLMPLQSGTAEKFAPALPENVVV